MSERYYRELKHFSPSSFKMYKENRTQYYQYYLSPRKLPRDPQNHHMAVGSAFDAYVKAYLYDIYVGDKNPKFDFTTLFEAQVEPHNRDQARIDGLRVFEQYKVSGALQDWSLKLNGCIGKPQFETDLFGIVDGYREGISKHVGAIPLMGKPDLYYTTACGTRIVSDWKVNGFYSKSGVSPKQGYVRLYPGMDVHKDCVVSKKGEHRYNTSRPLEQVDEEWAAQLAIYSWILGVPVGEEFLAMIHQIVCRPTGIRVAEHCALVSSDFQRNLYNSMQEAWYKMQDGLIFDDMTVEQSLAYAKSLDEAPPLTPEQLSLLGPQRVWR